jgi:hypothetical protein
MYVRKLVGIEGLGLLYQKSTTRMLVGIALVLVLAGASMAEGTAAPVRRGHHKHGAATQGAASPYTESHVQQLPDSARVPANPLPAQANDATGNAAHTSPVTCNAQNASTPACYAATQQAHPVGR